MNIYEHRSHPLLPWPKFLRRVGRHFVVALVVIGLALGVGVAGYHWLGGLGPVDPLKSDAAKIFAAIYALFAGLAFIGIAGLMLAPFAHRLLHRVHLEEN
jgi:hypothetical protein